MSKPYSFIAISDIHLGLKLFNLPELGQDLKDNFSALADLAIRKKVDYVFIVGDLFDTNRPSPDLISFVRQQVDKLNANHIMVAGIAGDHDKPVFGSSWIGLSGVLPMSFDRRFVGLDYCDDSPQLVTQLAEMPQEDKDKAEWIFLHGHVPELFRWSEQKKLLDLKQLDLLTTFPNLKGVVLGDIHVPTDSSISDPTGTRTSLPYIGYCGSLGITKTDEVNRKIGVLYYDGEKIQRLPFKLDRQFVKFHLADSDSGINWIQKFAGFFKDNKGKRPVIIVGIDKSTEERVGDLAPLYEIGIVRKVTERFKTEEEDETQGEIINIRSELKTKDRIEKVLRECAPDKETFDLAHALLNSTEDPTIPLDKLKKAYLD